MKLYGNYASGRLVVSQVVNVSRQRCVASFSAMSETTSGGDLLPPHMREKLRNLLELSPRMYVAKATALLCARAWQNAWHGLERLSICPRHSSSRRVVSFAQSAAMHQPLEEVSEASAPPTSHPWDASPFLGKCIVHGFPLDITSSPLANRLQDTQAQWIVDQTFKC